MCGIAGGFNIHHINKDNIFASLHHRGPDDKGFFEDRHACLFHTRLSIVDIDNAHQPMSYGPYTIVFNGEIYNHLDLRNNLKEFDFKTQSDTETLLYSFIKYKHKCLNMLDGMFAFCVYNKNTREFFLARDRAGKKPLFFYKNKSIFFFASELNCFKGNIPLEIDKNSINLYLRSGFFYQDSSPYKHVQSLQNSCFAYIKEDTSNIKQRHYYDFSPKKHNICSLDTGLEYVENALENSVKRRLLSSDLEVGAFLSGGIDSSLVVALASKYKKDLKTFTVKFQSSYDESALAKLTANKFGTEHIELSIDMNLQDDIDDILVHYGRPFCDSSAIPSFYVAKEAKKHLSVVLNGDGADELFGGYRRYVPFIGLLQYIRYFSFLKKVIPVSHNKQSIYNKLYRLLSIGDKKGVDFYLSCTSDIFEDYYKFDNSSYINKMDSFIKDAFIANASTLDKMLYLDRALILFCDLLPKIDIASMSNSLEARSPFLSKDMIDVSLRLCDNLKIKGLNTKYILRELAKKYLPKEIINQPKRGFEVPLANWIDGILKNKIYSYLSKGSFGEEFIQRSFIDKLLDNKLAISKEKRAKMLWSMFCLEMWHKKVFL